MLVSRPAGARRPGGPPGLAVALSLLLALLLGALSRDSVAADPSLDPGDPLPFPGPDGPPFGPENIPAGGAEVDVIAAGFPKVTQIERID